MTHDHTMSDQPWQRILHEPVNANYSPSDDWRNVIDGYETGSSVDHRLERISKELLTNQWLRIPIQEKLRKMPDPPLCFCGKLARKTTIYGHGVLYDCHWWTVESEKRICGFHIHGYAWDMFRKVLETGKHFSEHDPELRTCPYFNYTFCVLFHITNGYLVRHLKTSPKCFCQLPVIMSEKIEYRRPLRISIVFKCRNYDIAGAKPKCLYMLSAEQVPFIKPKQSIHQLDFDREFFNPKYKELLKQKGLVDNDEGGDREKEQQLATNTTTTSDDDDNNEINTSTDHSNNDDDQEDTNADNENAEQQRIPSNQTDHYPSNTNDDAAEQRPTPSNEADHHPSDKDDANAKQGPSVPSGETENNGSNAVETQYVPPSDDASEAVSVSSDDASFVSAMDRSVRG